MQGYGGTFSLGSSIHRRHIPSRRSRSRPSSGLPDNEANGPSIPRNASFVVDGRRQVYAGVFPMDSNDFPKLEESIRRVS